MVLFRVKLCFAEFRFCVKTAFAKTVGLFLGCYFDFRLYKTCTCSCEIKAETF